MGSEKFCLRWNDFESNISGAFRELREDKDFFDVTLACDDEQLQAHKVILSACSPFFRTVLRRNRHEHPLLYLKGVKYADLVSVLNFMYHGEVNVAQEELNSFLAVAEDLKVKGLTQGNNAESKRDPPPRSDPPKPRIRDLPEATPPIKRPRPGPSPQAPHRPPLPASQPTYHEEQDDDIQEVQPIVKSEPAPPAPEPNQYAAPHQGVVADPNMEYGEEYGEYEGYEEGDYDNAMMDPNMSGADGNKELDAQISRSVSQILDENGLKVWSCNVCHKTGKERRDLMRHVETHFSVEQNCHLCGKSAKNREALRSHIKTYHKPINSINSVSKMFF